VATVPRNTRADLTIWPSIIILTVSHQFPGAKDRGVQTRQAHGYNGAMPSLPKEFRLTERRNPASKNLDRMSSLEIVRLMNREDKKVAAAVAREVPAIARAVDEIVRSLRGGGRLIYMGAGSSGRLAILDAAECPPTFGVSRKIVQALIAGGRRAITSAVEGAEDSERNAERDLQRKKLSSKDAVVGVAARLPSCPGSQNEIPLSSARAISGEASSATAAAARPNRPIFDLAGTIYASTE